jgi:hypothetical protein
MTVVETLFAICVAFALVAFTVSTWGGAVRFFTLRKLARQLNRVEEIVDRLNSTSETTNLPSFDVNVEMPEVREAKTPVLSGSKPWEAQINYGIPSWFDRAVDTIYRSTSGVLRIETNNVEDIRGPLQTLVPYRGEPSEEVKLIGIAIKENPGLPRGIILIIATDKTTLLTFEVPNG